MNETTITIPKHYQATCPHCIPGMFDFRPKVVRNGLVCNHCKKLSYYKWTDEEVEAMKADYKQL